MRPSDRKHLAPLLRQLDHPPDPEGLKQAQARAREAFCLREAQGALCWWEFLYQQGRFLQKRWWLFQGILLLGLWALLREGGISVYTQRFLAVSGPLFVLLLMPELWKSRRANVLELEGVAYYSLRQVYAARMTLFALADLLLLSLFFLSMALEGQLCLSLVLQFFLPFSVSCCICFRTLYSRLPESLSLLLCGVWTVLWMELSGWDALYRLLTPPLWGGLLALALGYLAWSIARGQKNLPYFWEGMPRWN